MKTIEEQLAAYGDHLDELPVAAAAPRRARPRLALAGVAAVVLVVAAFAVLRTDDPPTVVGATDHPAVALVPAELPDGARIAYATEAPFTIVNGLAVFGDDRPRIVVEVNPDGSRYEGGVPTEVRGLPATFHDDLYPGGPALAWDEGGQRLTVRAAAGDVEPLLREFAEGVTADGLAVSAAWIPPAWRELWDAASVPPGTTERTYALDLADGGRLTVFSWSDAPRGAELGAVPSVRAEPTDVRGVRGWHEARGVISTFLWWRDPSGVVVIVHLEPQDEATARAFVETLVAVDQAGWQRLVEQAPAVADDASTVTTSVAVVVPDVVGLSAVDASSVLETAGFVVDVQGSGPTVIEQAPPPGSDASPGDVVPLRTAP